MQYDLCIRNQKRKRHSLSWIMLKVNPLQHLIQVLYSKLGDHYETQNKFQLLNHHIVGKQMNLIFNRIKEKKRATQTVRPLLAEFKRAIQNIQASKY